MALAKMMTKFASPLLYLQKTFNFTKVSFMPRFTSSLAARHANTLLWCPRVGTKLNVDRLTFPSDET